MADSTDTSQRSDSGVTRWLARLPVGLWHTLFHAVDKLNSSDSRWIRIARICFLLTVLAISLSLPACQTEEKKALALLYLQKDTMSAQSKTMSTLTHQNMLYLLHSEQTAMDEILTVTEINMVLDVVASSQIGVSFIADFNVTVGQALHRLSIVLERAEVALLISVAAISALQWLTYIAETYAFYLLGLGLAIRVAYHILCWLNQTITLPTALIVNTKHLSYDVLMVFVALHLVLPYSIHMGAAVDKKLTQHFIENKRTQLTNIHDSFVGNESGEALKKKASNSISKLKSMPVKDIRKSHQSITAYLLSRLLMNVFNLFLLPLGIFYLLYRLISTAIVGKVKLLPTLKTHKA